MDRDAFCRNLGCPLLVAATHRPGQSFQQARTRMMEEEERERHRRRGVKFSHLAAVIEVRRLDAPGDVRVGRSEENDIVLDEEEISAAHALFRWEGKTGRYSLEDLESTNGSSINQTALIPGRAVELKDRDQVQFGNLTYLFFYPGGFYDALTKGFDG
jgi:hypothetical protein